MNRNKKRVILLIAFIALIVVGIVSYVLFNNKEEYALNVTENKWIETNKQKVIDIAVINDLPIVSYEGTGVFYDYLDYVSKKHSLIQ